MKLIVAGSRSIASSIVVFRAIDRVRKIIDVTEIVSGAAKGVDSLGEAYAKANGLAVHVFPADWDQYGKRAGFIRNETMGVYADALLAVHDGVSKGTIHMINFMTKQNKRVFKWTHKGL